MKKLILVISALLLLLIGGFYFWDLRNEVSEIKAVVTEQAENTNAEKKNIKETAEESKEEKIGRASCRERVSSPV